MFSVIIIVSGIALYNHMKKTTLIPNYDLGKVESAMQLNDDGHMSTVYNNISYDSDIDNLSINSSNVNYVPVHGTKGSSSSTRPITSDNLPRLVGRFMVTDATLSLTTKGSSSSTPSTPSDNLPQQVGRFMVTEVTLTTPISKKLSSRTSLVDIRRLGRFTIIRCKIDSN